MYRQYDPMSPTETVSTEGIYRMIGQRVRSERMKRQLKQEDLARKLNLSRTSITNIENGNQKILVHTLMDLAKALEIPAASFLEQSQIVGVPDSLPAKTKIWLELLAASTIPRRLSE
jgi:transcriptional regulator with XRE-family HTH domain